MLLSEQGMNRAQSLASEFVRMNRDNQAQRFEDAFNDVKRIVSEVWNVIKNTIQDLMSRIHDASSQLKEREEERSNWHVPMKIEAPKIPDIKIPRFAYARSNI